MTSKTHAQTGHEFNLLSLELVPSGLLQRKCACGGSSGLTGECEGCRKKKLLQRRAVGPAEPTEVPSIVHQVLRSPGQPLDPATRAFFEPRFGHDFSRVRIHTDAQAAASAQAVNALAYTVGRHVAFARGDFAPVSHEGRRLLAHELTHVVQQGGVPVTGSAIPIGPTRDEHERDAEAVAAGRAPGPPGPDARGPVLQRAALDIAAVKSEVDQNPLWLPLVTQGRLPVPVLIPLPLIFFKGPRSGEIAAAFAAGSLTSTSGPDNPVPTDPSLPLEAHFFPSASATQKRALIFGGFHGDERPGYELAEAFIAELSSGGGVLAGGSILGYHTLIIPRVNPGGIADELAGVTTYDRRCNRQKVDLNANLPTGHPASSERCPNTETAPQQPETSGVVKAIAEFQPHRIMSLHAIRDPKNAGVFADPNTDRTVQDLACALAAFLPNDMKKGNIRKLTKGLPKDLTCNPLYHGDKLGDLEKKSLGAYAPTRSIPGEIVPVITVEVPKYGSLTPAAGNRSIETFLGVVREFVKEGAP